MKTILLILLNLQLIYGAIFNSTGSVYSGNHHIPTSEYRIGYTTSYGYTNNDSNGIWCTGQPRRVIIKHDNDSIDTRRTDDWNPEWRYYHGSVLGIGFDDRWYYNDGSDMYFWNGRDWEHTGRWDWIHTHDPSFAHPSAPIGDPPFFIILGLLLLWMIYDIFIRSMIKNDKK